MKRVTEVCFTERIICAEINPKMLFRESAFIVKGFRKVCVKSVKSEDFTLIRVEPRSSLFLRL